MTMTHHPIELTNIASELSRLSEEAQGQNKIRACLFNLIIYTQKSQRDRYYQELIHTVISKYPCRVILITSDDQTRSDYLKTSVTAETVGEGDRKILCEIIHIEVGGKPHERVPYIILPHILPDLPVHLLWTQDPAMESVVLPALEPFASRVIFDAESSPDLQQFSQAVLKLTGNFHCSVGDLNWSSLSGWRNLFAHTFDSPEAIDHLHLSKRIAIHFNQQPIEAAYFQGWLAAQMEWEFQNFSHQGKHWTLTYESTRIELIAEDDPDMPPGVLLSVEVESAHEEAHYTFKRHPKTRQVSMQYTDRDRCDLPHTVNLPGLSEGQEVIQEIFYPQPLGHYCNMLNMLARTPWSQS